MRKIFSPRRNALLSSTSLSWGGVALAFAAAALLLRVVAPDLFWSAVAPVFRFSETLAGGSRALVAGFNDRAALMLENERLVRENAALILENRMLTERQNDLSGVTGGAGAVTAGVVARPPESPYDTLIVASGSAEGVSPGMEAFGLPAGETGKGEVPLGVVSLVLEHFSRVTLFSSPGVSTSGWAGKNPITLRGAGGGTFTASVSRAVDVTAGDVVSVPGPGKLPMGTVVRVDSDPSSPSAALRISPALNPFSVSWVVLRESGAELRSALSLATSSLP